MPPPISGEFKRPGASVSMAMYQMDARMGWESVLRKQNGTFGETKVAKDLGRF